MRRIRKDSVLTQWGPTRGLPLSAVMVAFGAVVGCRGFSSDVPPGTGGSQLMSEQNGGERAGGAGILQGRGGRGGVLSDTAGTDSGRGGSEGGSAGAGGPSAGGDGRVEGASGSVLTHAGSPAQPPECPGCSIEGSCLPDGALNPQEPCQSCDVSRRPSAWSSRDGAACDDGLFCNGSDHCLDGSCSQHAGMPCDDGVQCDGAEGCSEAAGCLPGQPQCSEGQVCRVSTDRCEATCGGCLIDGVCHDEGVERPGQPCEVCERTQAPYQWTERPDGYDCGTSRSCRGGGCVCNGHWAEADCATCVVYVTGLGHDSSDGASWSNAKATIQAGIDAAAERVAEGLSATCEVWVAEGRYVPAGDEGREATLRLQPQVHVYGGFAGTEQRRGERDWTVHPTTVSGDVQGDDVVGDAATRVDNLYHVVVGANAAVWDGFIVSGGQGDGSDTAALGGGFLNDGTSPTVRNTTFRDNGAICGAGMYNGAGAAPEVTACAFEGNTAGQCGGGMLNDNAFPEVRDVRFAKNSAPDGGGMCNRAGAAPVVTDTTFAENEATNGGGMSHQRAAGILRRVQFVKNSAQVGGGLYAGDGSSPTVVSSSFTSNEASDGGGGMANQDGSNPTVTECTFVGNTAIRGAGMLNSSGALPALTGCTFQTNDAQLGGGIANLSSSPRIDWSRFDGNTAQSGGAIFDRDDASPLITNCTIVSNKATERGGGIYDEDGASPSVEKTLFQSNVADDEGAGMASLRSSPTVIDSRFEGNEADRGGGIANLDQSEITVRDSTFLNGRGSTRGGGLYNEKSTAVVEASVFEGNHGGWGGGIANYEQSTATVRGCTFRGNKAPAENGGGMRNSYSTALVEDSVFDANIAYYGAGIGDNGSWTTIRRCTFLNGQADSRAGGLYVRTGSSATVEDSVFEGNRADYGGATHQLDQGSITVRNCAFRGNSAKKRGGAAYCSDSSFVVLRSIFDDNDASDGGGIFTSTCESVVQSTSFIGNSAPGGLGGGMLNDACPSLAITNCLFAANSAALGAAVASRSDSRPVVTNATFSGNTAATAGGALYNVGSFPTVTNSILWADTSNGAVSEVHNVEGSSAAITYSTVAGGCALETCTSDDTANLSSDPRFVDAEHGDYRLESGSPCIDAGNGAVLPSDAYDLDADDDRSEATPDLADRGRVLDGNGDGLAVADQGAYEF